MHDPKSIAEALEHYLRISTFPIGITMVAEESEIPEKARRPTAHFGHKYATCQAIAIARRYGWTLALDISDMACSLGVVVVGFAEPTPTYSEGHLCAGFYTESAEAGAKSEEAVDKLPAGSGRYLVVGPLRRFTELPDVVCIYGNSAQVMRCVQGALWKRGGALTSSFEGRIDCADIIATPQVTGECQVVLPCSGDRIFAQTEDWEMAFTIPRDRIEEVLEGLEGTHKAGLRYPITSFLDYHGKFPPKYVEFLDELTK
jgi:uncharacterized protein (DUF169 family)